MKTVKFISAFMLAFMVTATFAANNVSKPNFVKSKMGDIELTKNNGETVCTASFNDELKILKNEDTKVLVKGTCGQGWVDKTKIEYIAQGPGDKSFTLGNYDVWGHTDNPGLIDIFYDDLDELAEVDINRDFKEYLTYTMDREQTEMRNGEN